ncbi:helix-turn-helix domain-containing protein [Paraburkholderia sp. MM6662-R1]|uniref:helix-turn-helix domain-containing protein n=1 Tax=Paraburkholderia sp. MM6662-R1 TaxID=2991066 RepID=UPI003D2357BE
MNQILPNGDLKAIPFSVLPNGHRLPEFGMSTAEHRRERLRHLIDSRYKGRQVDFLKDSGESQSEISGILNGRKSFGEKKARKIERTLDLPEGWLDSTTPARQPSAAELLSMQVERIRSILSGRSAQDVERAIRILEVALADEKVATEPPTEHIELQDPEIRSTEGPRKRGTR